jgi:non-ribosomal peptide synthetase component F
MLRTTVAIEAGHPALRVASQVSLAIAEVDLRSLPVAERDAEMMRQIREASAEPFDLEQGPLFRSTLFRLDERRSLYFTLRHNLVWDGWSFDVFLRELCAVYGMLERGVPPELTELPVSYGDFAIWQREWSQGQELRSQVEWWQKTLGNSPPDLELPTDHARPSQPSYRGGNVASKLSRAEADALTALARGAGTTLFTVLFAAYTALLHRFSGQTEVLVGTPVRARNLPEVEDIIGPFINTIVLRAAPQPEQSFDQYLNAVKEITLDAFSNQDMPLEMLGTRPPALRAFFSFQDARERPVSLGSAKVRQVDVEPPAAANDLMLWMMERPDELVAVANYSTDLFERETVELLLRSFTTLVRDVIANPKAKLSALKIISDDDAAELQTSPSPMGEAGSLAHALFLERAEHDASAVAYVEDGRSTSFETLVRRSRIVTATLNARGIQSRASVGVLLPPGGDLLLAALAVWQAGGAVLALDPAAPRAFNELVCARANVALVVTSAAFRESAPNRPLSIIEELAVGSNEPLPVAPDQPAWIHARLNAAGEVELQSVSHQELCAAARSLCAQLQVTKGDSLALASSIGSEALPVFLLLGAFSAAATVFVDPDAASSEDAKRANHLLAPLSSALELLPAVRGEQLRQIVIDGPASTRALTQLLPAGVAVSTLEVLGGDRPAFFLSSKRSAEEELVIGKPLGLGRAVVRQSDGRAAPTGALGTLGVTASPGEPQPTGLRARRRRDGSFALACRPSDRTSLQGTLVEHALVARTLEAHPAVARAVVRSELAENGAAHLIAYVAARANETFTQTELRRELRRSLPNAMIPSQFVELERMPTLADGSVDRAALPSPFTQLRRVQHVEPRTDAERLLAASFRDALGLESVSIYDNFFDLGGHSLLCFQVMARVEAETGKRLSPRLFLLNTLEQVAAVLQETTTITRTAAEPAPNLAGRVLQRLGGFWPKR